MMEKIKYPRQVAIKINLGCIHSGNYVQATGEEPSYLICNQKKYYRLNIIAVITNKEEVGSVLNLLIEDGTEKILVRCFEDKKNLKELSIGDSVLIIGKVREYNQEKYVSPEIIKKVNSTWLKVRALELEKEIIQQEAIEDVEKEVVKNDKEDENDKNNLLLPVEKITKMIKDLDLGEGVMIEEIIAKSSIEQTEDLLQKMLENGEIFQNQPGKVKVL